jgi:hypothetical protein
MFFIFAVVELMCFKHGLPEIGSDFHVCQSDEKAEEIAQARSLARYRSQKF